MRKLCLLALLLFPGMAKATSQTGSLTGAAGNVSGTMTAGFFVGNGSGLTSLSVSFSTITNQFNQVASDTTTLGNQIAAGGASTAALAALFVTNPSSSTNTSAQGLLVRSSVTANAFFGDGSHLTGIAGGSFNTAVGSFTVVGELSVGSTITLRGNAFVNAAPSSGNIMFRSTVAATRDFMFQTKANLNFGITDSNIGGGAPDNIILEALDDAGSASGVLSIGNDSNNGVIIGGKGAAADTLDIRGSFGWGNPATRSTGTANGSLAVLSSVTANAFFGDGSHLTGISGGFSGGNVANLTTFQAGMKTSTGTWGSGATQSTMTATGDLVLATDADITLAGANALFSSASSVTASGFFGDGSHLTGIPSTASISGIYAPLAGATFTGASGITNQAFTATGANGNIVSGASVTASGLFGNGNQITFSTVQIRQDGALANTGFTNAPIVMIGSVNSFFQAVIQNISNGTNASGDLVINNDLGGPTSYYLDIGINSSKFSQSDQTAAISSAAYVMSSHSDLLLWGGALGAANGSQHGDLILGTSTQLLANIAMRISSATSSGPGAVNVFSSMTVLNGGGIRALYNVTAGSMTVGGTTVNCSTCILDVRGGASFFYTEFSSGVARSSFTVKDGGWIGRDAQSGMYWDAAASANMGAMVFMSSSGITFAVDTDQNDTESIIWQKNSKVTGSGTNIMVLSQSAELYSLVEVNSTKADFGSGNVGTNCSTCTVVIRAGGGGLSVEGGNIQGNYALIVATAAIGAGSAVNCSTCIFQVTAAVGSGVNLSSDLKVNGTSFLTVQGSTATWRPGYRVTVTTNSASDGQGILVSTKNVSTPYTDMVYFTTPPNYFLRFGTWTTIKFQIHIKAGEVAAGHGIQFNACGTDMELMSLSDAGGVTFWGDLEVTQFLPGMLGFRATGGTDGGDYPQAILWTVANCTLSNAQTFKLQAYGAKTGDTLLDFATMEFR